MDQDIQIPNITYPHNLTLTTIDSQAHDSFKKTNTIQMYNNCSLEASQNKIMSSAKRWEIFKPPYLWDLAWKPPSSVLFKNLLNTSIIKRNNNGDRVLPWLIPWELPTGDLFTSIENLTIEIQALIHLPHLAPKSILRLVIQIVLGFLYLCTK